ncbi:MAG: hypothetical protein JRN39_01440 [Nitrososphaerota archaeon]|nr:hypothetical protein [Nitrososphaerota archaeon]
MTQLKFVVDDDLARRFKQLVVARRGKLELTPEGEAALLLYIREYGSKAKSRPQTEPLIRALGAVKSKGKPNALRDLKRFEAEN